MRSGLIALALVLTSCSASDGRRCGPGTRAEGSTCVIDGGAAACGRGTHLEAEACLADATPAAFCGPGTVVAGNVCAPAEDPSPWCGPGTSASGAACVLASDPTPYCGPGTEPHDGTCRAALDAAAYCGPGTVAGDSGCEPAASPEDHCGPGTVLAGDRCVADLDPTSWCGPGTVLATGRCVAAGAPEGFCGPGTRWDSGRCAPATDPALLCGPGTELSGGVCVSAADPARFCGPGTVLTAGRCEPSTAPGAWCGPGTTFDGAACVPSLRPADHCGRGTVLSGDRCLPSRADADHCGPGTHLAAGVCAPDAEPEAWCGPGTYPSAAACLPSSTGGYEIRLQASTAPADGVSKFPVRVLGPPGSTEPLVLAPTRAGAVTLDAAQLVPGPAGTTTFAAPCAASRVGCLGSVRIAAYRASDPSRPVAVSEPLTLVPQTGIGNPAACLGGENVLFLDGSSWEVSFTAAIADADIGGEGSPYLVSFGVRPSDPAFAELYMVGFSTRGLGVELQEGVYLDARDAWAPTAGHPGVGLIGDHACNPAGRFQVRRLQLIEHVYLAEFLATFEIDCTTAGAPIRGCIHYTAP